MQAGARAFLLKSDVRSQLISAVQALGVALAVTGVIAVATYMANAVSHLSAALGWLRWLSPFHYFIGTDPLHSGWHPAHLLLLAAIGAITAAAGVVAFDRRDLGV